MSLINVKHCCLWCFLFMCSGMYCFGSTRAVSREFVRATKGPCGDIDIRNNVEQFQKLVNCTVIEGELQIVLIDKAKAEDYESLHFPDLVEIKDYLLLYRVNGLRSLRNIFPNLAIIRGEKLFSDYALIAFQMQSLEELGLVSLMSIPKGAIRLEKNPNLCYIETIDWTKIATGIPDDENFFKGNKDTKECVNTCPKSCDTTTGYDRQEPRCWTLKDCQRMLVPTSPTNLQVKAEHPGELHITWDPPLKPNGNVTNYKVYWQLSDLDTKQYELRDYCAYPLAAVLRKRDQDDKDGDKRATLDGECCTCPPSQQELKLEAREREMDIQFQTFLQNQVYIKRRVRPATTLQPNRRRKRGRRVRRQLPITSTPDPHEKENPYFRTFVYETRELYIRNLGHFEEYYIEVIACQDRDPRDTDKNMLCSDRVIRLGRTMPKKTADSVNASTVHVNMINNRTGAVHIRWDNPKSPNGLIVTYEIEYSKTNIQNVKPTLICIKYKMFRDVGKKGHTLENLGAGNYTFRIRATSLAGNGPWTEPRSFNIPAFGDEEETIQLVPSESSTVQPSTSNGMSCNERKRPIKPDDVTQAQYEVLQLQKQKIVQQIKYYELLNKKLAIELES